MREIVAIHIGQGGIQVGNECWELFCLEHGIQPDGKRTSDSTTSMEDSGSNKIFGETTEGTHRPRAVFIDLEPTVIDNIRTGMYRHLFHPMQLISGKAGGAQNHARGRYTIGKEIIDLCLDRIRQLTEACTGFQGFLIFNSVGGGTGSGLGSLLLERLSVEYGTKSKVALPIFPSPKTSPSIVEPYNSVLASHVLLEHADASIMLDNEAIYDICQRQLNIDLPTYKNLNRIIAQLTALLTTSLRFGGSLNVDLGDFATNLVPFPRVNFMLSSFGPLIPSGKEFHKQLTIEEITLRVLKAESMMAKCEPRYGKSIACCLNFHGDLVPKHVGAAVYSLTTKEAFKFQDRNPTRFKCELNYHPLPHVPGGDLAKRLVGVSLISNHTSIAEVFSRISHKFDLLFFKRAFVHWYVREGMEEGEFFEAREDLAMLEKAYEEIGV